MAKRTAIIDLGSNSVRMVVFEKSSRYGFSLIKEVKSRVRLGEGAYEKGGFIQPTPMQRAYETLCQFHKICTNLRVNKIFCVATSALRDAPNKKEFIQKVQKGLGFNIKIIDGDMEANYGAIATINLLPKLKSATTVDIGGGSTELAKIEDGKIVDTISLNVGTVRVKELFYDGKKGFGELEEFLQNEFSKVPKHFQTDLIVGIGGTLRAISNAIMERDVYPLKTVHGFRYDLQDNLKWIESISTCSVLDVKDFGFKKERFDTIREGCAIFAKVAQLLGAKEVISSGAGVREGLFLTDLLRSSNGRFPSNFNPSIKSLQDRFSPDVKNDAYVAKNALALFDSLVPLHKIDSKYRFELSIASKLSSIGSSLSIYQEHIHSFYFILSNLNFGFTHSQKLLIALLIKNNTRKISRLDDYEVFCELLPDAQTINWLSYILAFSKALNIDLSKSKLEFSYANQTLHVQGSKELLLAKEAIKKLSKPAPFATIFS